MYALEFRPTRHEEKSDATIYSATSFSHMSLGPKICSRPIRLLDLGVSLVLDPDVNPTLGLTLKVSLHYDLGRKHPVMDLMFGLKIEPKLEDRFLN